MTTGLVIVDMQPGFGRAVELALPATLKEVEIAVRRKAPIAIVQLAVASHKETHDDIMKLVKDYPLFGIREKFGGDGSREAQTIFDGLNFKPKKLRICGVYTSQCVKNTVTGLNDWYNQCCKMVGPNTCSNCQPCELILVKEACSDSTDDESSQQAEPRLSNYTWNWVETIVHAKISYKQKFINLKKAS